MTKDKKLLLGLILSSIIPLWGAIFTKASFLWPISVFIYNAGLLNFVSKTSNKTCKLISLYLVTSVFFVFEAAYFLSFSLQNKGFNDAFFYHLRLDVIYAGIEEHLLVLMVIFACLAGFLILCSHTFRFSQPSQGWVSYVGLGVFVLGLVISPSVRELLQYVGVSPPEKSEIFKTFPELQDHPLSVAFKKEKRSNVVLIYLESLEQRFFDQTVFPGLLPKLGQIKQQSIEFSNVAQGVGAGWTIGGIVASQCAYPLTVNQNVDPNDFNIFDQFLPKATCLGDLLASDGYNLVFIGGADKRFAGKEKFLRAHGYKQVLGLNDLRERLTDDSYLTPWGLYDDTMIEAAIDTFHKLSRQPSPFFLTLLTLNSHGYDGYLSDSCQPYPAKDNSILHAMHCTDQLISKFVAEIRRSAYSQNTLIVVVSDHLAMRNRATPLLEKSKEPDMLTFFVDTPAGISETNSNPGVHFDIGPTILDLMGYKLDGQMGFGRPLAQGPGYLPAKFRNGWASLTRDILAAGNTLWDNETVIDKHGIVFTASNLNLTIGKKSFNLSAGGFVDAPTTAVFLFNAQTLKVEKLYTYPLEQGLTENMLGELLLDNRNKLALAIGRAQFLKGFSDPKFHPDQWVLFFGKPESEEFLSGSITGDFFISPETIEKIIQGQTNERLVRQRQLALGVLSQ